MSQSGQAAALGRPAHLTLGRPVKTRAAAVRESGDLLTGKSAGGVLIHEGA